MKRGLNNVRWYARWPIKWALFGLAYVAVCFPYPHLLVRHLVHWSNPASLIEPHAPALEPLAEALAAELPVGPPAWDTLRFVERFVYRAIPYAWDWDTWGMADYIPTVAEVVQKGREDCDGRAVLAASLLQRIGVQAQLVSDITHVWVATNLGETMGPRPHRAIETTEEGVRFDLRGLRELPRALAFGISVFPLLRELILVAVAWLLLLDRRMYRLVAVVSLVLLLGGVWAVRQGGANAWGSITWLAWLGFAAMTVGLLLPLVLKKRSTTATPSNAPQGNPTNSDNRL